MRATSSRGVTSLCLWACPFLSALNILKQSVHIVLLDCTRGSRLALGTVCRERILSAPSASDDVMIAGTLDALRIHVSAVGKK